MGYVWHLIINGMEKPTNSVKDFLNQRLEQFANNGKDGSRLHWSTPIHTMLECRISVFRLYIICSTKLSTLYAKGLSCQIVAGREQVV